ncbi:DUF2254 domain-containing protein [Allosphingosinicella sp.]|uniref:DUF2254 domain-containing protein n=1 Tax=Allosphingosinicella sp. TaxID=2823234 RepID=UPI002FC24989
MQTSLRKFWLSLNASYWFIPTLLTLTALVLSFATIYIDRNGGAQWLTDLGWVQVTRPDGARSLLTVISSSMIGVASTVFAITIAAVVYASGTYGPRLLTNFMTDRGNQLSLGVFVATFVYGLMVLRVVRAEDEVPATAADAAATYLPGFVPQISLLIAVALLLLSVAVLVYFLHHIPASIRINSVLAGIGRRLLRDIEERFPKANGARSPSKGAGGKPVAATATGYVEIIDFDRLDDIARAVDATISLKVRTGDFIHPPMVLLHVVGADPDGELSAELRGAFAVGAARTPTQDLEYLFDELVEIALRALSPAINDPFTAITSLHWVGAATASLAGRNLCRGPEQEDYDAMRVRPREDDFSHFVARGFGGIRLSAAGNPLAAKVFIEMLASAVEGCELPERRAVLAREAKLLEEQAEVALAGPALDEIREKVRAFEASLRVLR